MTEEKSIYEENKEICDKILDFVAQGNSVRSAFDKLKGLPARKTFYEWLKKDETLSNRYARATEIRSEKIFEEILTIADNQEDDIIQNEDGIEITNHNVIQRARLRIDARKWVLAKMIPTKYGDKIDLNHSGGIDIGGYDILDPKKDK